MHVVLEQPVAAPVSLCHFTFVPSTLSKLSVQNVDSAHDSSQPVLQLLLDDVECDEDDVAEDVHAEMVIVMICGSSSG
jgi:hypothetical protein